VLWSVIDSLISFSVGKSRIVVFSFVVLCLANAATNGP